MKNYNVLIFPCGTEIANEAINALRNHKYFKILLASSEGTSYCNFRNQNIDILPYVTEETFENNLNELIQRKNIDFIVPAHDDVAYSLSYLADTLKCKIIGQSKMVNDIVRFKDKTYSHFKNILPIAKIFNELPNKEDFPVFIKPIKGQGALNAIPLDNLKQFDSFFNINPIDEYIIMEKLTGQEFTIDCFSHQGQVLYQGARTRDKMTRGIAVQSSYVTDSSLNIEFEKFSHIISNHLEMHGIWFFQMKFDKKNELKLLEIGPRIPGSMMLNRARGVNFIELALYQSLNYNVTSVYNNIDISMARALVPIYKHNIKYNTLYIDFDDTLFLNETRINSELIKLIFDAKNENKKIVLITKNKKNNLTTVLHQYGITNIFNEIIHIKENEMKITYMDKKSLLIDDSFVEREQAIKDGHYAYSVDNINII